MLSTENLTYEETASLYFGAHAALHFLRKANIQHGVKLLVYGASGAVGSSAVQIAKYMGGHVTGVCSTNNVEMVKLLGADEVVDYTKSDFSDAGTTYDVIFDTVGKSSFSNCIQSLTNSGIYLKAVHMDLASIFRGLWVSMTSQRKVIGGAATETTEDLEYVRDLAQTGDIRPVIDRVMTLGQIAEAHEYVDKGHKKGNVVIKVEHDDS